MYQIPSPHFIVKTFHIPFIFWLFFYERQAYKWIATDIQMVSSEHI